MRGLGKTRRQAFVSGRKGDCCESAKEIGDGSRCCGVDAVGGLREGGLDRVRWWLSHLEHHGYGCCRLRGLASDDQFERVSSWHGTGCLYGIDPGRKLCDEFCLRVPNLG